MGERDRVGEKEREQVRAGKRGRERERDCGLEREGGERVRER